MIRQRVFTGFLLLGILFLQFVGSVGGSRAASNIQDATPNPIIQAILDQMTPEEKVGQLFLIEFNGIDLSPESQTYDLIVNHHIGGVILRAENDNFVAAPDTVLAAWELNQSVQNAEYNASLVESIEPVTGETFSPVYIPLLIGISQEGDGFPYDQIYDGLTELPSAMAIGATWQPELARQVGEVLGKELSALGFNLLLGPSLDVLTNPNPESPGDLGARSFGGDPYWVGQMGRAYISGVHEGSQGKIVTVAKHLPGQGGLDQPPEQEIPTVRKSLEQLTQIELVPFFAVTGGARSDIETVDAMLLSHIRYEGFQGNIQATTRPVSLDPQAFSELMDLEPFAAWRAAGGIIISDELGTRAVRRFYDNSEENFTRLVARDVAREAFLAGNDILYLGDFTADVDLDSYRSIIATLEFFSQKYRDDVAFAQRVDESLERILEMKLKMYAGFDIDSVLPSETGLQDINQNDQISFEVSRQAATLLSPNLADLDTALPAVPDLTTRVIFFSDTSTYTQCSECPPQEDIPEDALAQAVNRFYGPSAGGQVFSERLLSYSVLDLEQLLDNDAEETNPLMELVQGAQWMVFVMQDLDSERPETLLLRKFLSERPDLIQDKKLVVFAVNAPYYLNATEISKVTVYYALYSNGPEFIDVAARLLFKEVSSPGASPVSVSGVGYDLFTVTSPDPERIISLFLDLNGETDLTPTERPGDGAPLEFQVGDLVVMRTGIILDHNGNQVPDETPVRFLITGVTEGAFASRELTATTVDGIAQTSLRVDNSGTLEVQVASGEPAALSELIRMEIVGDDAGLIEPTQTSEAIQEPTPSPDPSDELEVLGESDIRTQTTLGDWVSSLLVSLFVGLFAYQTGASGGRISWGVRWGLMALIGGLLANLYLAFGLQGTEWILLTGQVWGVVFSVLASAVAGWAFGWIWWKTTNSD